MGMGMGEYGDMAGVWIVQQKHRLRSKNRAEATNYKPSRLEIATQLTEAPSCARTTVTKGVGVDLCGNVAVGKGWGAHGGGVGIGLVW